MRAFNFSPGPAALPDSVLEQARDELLDYRGKGLSVMEMSHRSREFMEIAEGAEADLRELLGIGDDYHVLSLQGGASMQFAMVPFNLCGGEDTVDYIHTAPGAARPSPKPGNWPASTWRRLPRPATSITFRRVRPGV